MGVNRFEDLVAWQLARDLRDLVIAATKTAALADDRQLCDQLRRAVRSPAANIAEGFGRWHRRDFARFLGIARASLMEVQTHLGDVRHAGLLSASTLDDCDSLARRAIGATTRLIQSLGPHER